MNYSDIIFILILGYYLYRGYKLGFLVLLTRLVSFGGGLFISLLIYQHVGRLLVARITTVPSQIVYIISFIVVFILAELLLGMILRRIFQFIPEAWRLSRINKIAGVVPAIVDGFLFIGLLVLLSTILPVQASIKQNVSQSQIGGYVMNTIPKLDDYAQRLFGNRIEESLTHFSVRPNPDESVSIPFKPKTVSIDEEAERAMLDLVNEERRKVGAQPLVIDRTIVEVARKHSRDMWQRGYFAHENPDGADPFDRMEAGGASFITAGENLAFAQTVGIAHTGLMNSPGHKRNILDPNFGRVGIGVISGGIYGKMFTQNFAN
ncbi:MAG: CvpA family protein [Patescibacteria group bacterium]